MVEAAREALETQRKAMNARCNELSRLIAQTNKNQKTALLPEKLNDLIVFLEPADSETANKEAAKSPTQAPLMRRGHSQGKGDTAPPQPLVKLSLINPKSRFTRAFSALYAYSHLKFTTPESIIFNGT